MRDQSADKVLIFCKGKDQKQHNSSGTKLVKKKRRKYVICFVTSISRLLFVTFIYGAVLHSQADSLHSHHK